MFKGKFKFKNSSGTPYTYSIGDVVIFQGKIYECLQITQQSPFQSSGSWRLTDLTENYQGASPPLKGIETQMWLSDDAVQYLYFQDENSSQWIQPGSGGGGAGGAVSIMATTFVSGSSYQVLDGDYYVGVSYAGPVTITLPTFPETGREIVVKDESGNAGDGVNRQITITGYSATDKIDNQTSAIINLDYAGLHFIYRNGWRII